MASTTFIDNTTPVIAAWLNDVNTVAYNTVPAIISGAQVVGAATTATSATNSANVTGTIASGATATTQTAGDSTTKVATTAFVTTAVAAITSTVIPKRQTVLSGPVDSNGLPSFGGSTGSTTVTATGTLIATAANGFSSAGQVDRVGSITNPSWTSLSTNGTIYLYLDIASNGTCTTGSTTLEPTYRFGGADVTTNNQFTFNTQEMIGKVGNGSVATQTYRVFVGEVTVSGSVVSAITWYALCGTYIGTFVNTLPGTATSATGTHNLGTNFGTKASLQLKCLTGEGGWTAGDLTDNAFAYNAAYGYPHSIRVRSLTAYVVGGSNTSFNLENLSTGSNQVLTAANWAYRFIVRREW